MKRRFVPENSAIPSAEPLEMLLGERLWHELVGSGGAWWSRLASVHRQLLEAYGVPLPTLELTFSSELPVHRYGFRLAGEPWEYGDLQAQRWFATGPQEVVDMLMGEAGVEPVYGLEGRWISESRAAGAAELGCHLLRPEALWVGHLCDRLEARLDRTLDAAWLAAQWKQRGLGKLGDSQLQVCRWLLQERVSIRPLELIHEACRGRGEARQKLARTRQRLGAYRLAPWLTAAGKLEVLSLTEGTLRRLEREWKRPAGAEDYFLHQVLGQMHAQLGQARLQGHDLAVLVSAPLRREMFELLPWELRRLPVFSFEELPSELPVEEAVVVGSGLLGEFSPWPQSRI